MSLLLASGLLTLAFLILFWLTPLGAPALRKIGHGKPSPDLTFGYRPDETYELIDSYGARGIAHWRRLLLLDLVFPATYALFLALVMDRWVHWAGAGPGWRGLAMACPIVSACADYAENLLLLRVLAALPRRHPVMVSAASLFTRIKFAAFVLTLVLPLLFAGFGQACALWRW